MEAAEPRGPRPQHDPEAGAPLVQVHGVHGHLRHVQAVRESRVLGAQRRRQEGHGQEELVVEQERSNHETAEDQRRNHDNTAAGEGGHHHEQRGEPVVVDGVDELAQQHAEH